MPTSQDSLAIGSPRNTRSGKARAGRNPSLRDMAYEAIKHRIITCELKPGEVASEAVLSAALGIGRTPVHQALDRLMLEGLVAVLPRKGVVVHPVSLDEIFDIIEVRLINESYCAKLAAERAERAEIAQLEANLSEMRKAADRREIEELMRLDREFHNILSGAARNAVLAEILRKLHERSLRFWFISLKARDHHLRVCEQHAAIINAIRAHDPEAAESAMRGHIEAFRANVTRQL